jgi:hypothetical protein
MEFLGWALVFFVWLVACWLAFVYVAVPLTLAGVAAGLLAGMVLAAVGFLRVYVGRDDERAVARPSEATTRRWHAPYPSWDLGWPNYLSWQVERDIAAACDWPRDQVASWWSGAATWARRRFEWVLLGVPFAVPALAFLIAVTIGVYGALAAYAVAVEAVTAIPRLARLVLIGSIRAGDASVRWWRGAVTTCPSCRWVARLPAYRCGAASCRVVHRDIRPGRLGVLWRRCECGKQLPTSVLRATRALIPRCPACEYRLHDRAGVVRDARIALSGGPAAGKTGLLIEAAVTMTANSGHPPAWEPVDDFSTAWLRGIRPEGIQPPATTDPPLVTLTSGAHGRQRYVHLADVDGKHFATDANDPALRQLRTTRRHLLVIDATTIPSVRDRIDVGKISAEPDTNKALRSATNIDVLAELSYHLLVAQLSRMGARTRRCSLAIVVAKADVAAAWGVTPPPNSSGVSSRRLRDWLCAMDLRNLVEMAEHDFDDVRYFLVGRGMESTDPAAPFEWLLNRYLRGAALP